jgi:hypothetical protein
MMIVPPMHDTDTGKYSPGLEFTLTLGALTAASGLPFAPPRYDSVVAATPRLKPSAFGGVAGAMHPFDLLFRGEQFQVVIEDGQVFLEHPVWSLVGVGSSLVAAEFDLESEALDLADVMRDMSDAALSPDARRLRDFVLRF